MYVNFFDILTLSSDAGNESYTYYIECKSDDLNEIQQHLEFLRDNSKHLSISFLILNRFRIMK